MPSGAAMTFQLKPFLAVIFLFLSAFPASAREIVINAVGDIMLAGSGAATFQRRGYDYAFAATSAK